MKKMNIIAAVVLAAALAVPALAGENIYANGTITLAANIRTNTQVVGLYNTGGQEWGFVKGMRVANDGLTTGTITLACTDLGSSDQLATMTVAPSGTEEYNCESVEYASSTTANGIITYGYTFNTIVTTNIVISGDATNSVLSYAVVPTRSQITNAISSASAAPTASYSAAARSLLITVVTEVSTNVAQTWDWCVYAE